MNSTITSPVARSLRVADSTRASAFYRDVLGFDVKEHEAVSGPVRIEFEDQGRPVVLFLQTSDVTAMR